MTTNNALKPATTMVACTVLGCGFRMAEVRALVPSIDAMQRLEGMDGGIAPIAKLNIAAHIVCSRCAREIRHAVPGVEFFYLTGTRDQIARRIAARAEREAQREADRKVRVEATKVARMAERKAGMKTAIGSFAGLRGGAVKTEGRDGRKLVGAAADAVVRKAITKIADQNEIALREDAEKKAAREKAVAEKKSALDARNAAMTAAAVSGR